ncbi:hypothetical protein AZI86_11785 [Bdellovibrio bacteriovorus]|uniref:Uncharacterized protein n=1 Tax=Bdellovibrio bacteriovorus TaxID=959 RepID=A0A150WM24_BDEBC|nr:hypothetical protein [Bdellovibrio bacteriovorus]KYG64875.1 hypothetical protein AZI86_11785 [Bdellovibrio bacteriovorus]
MNLEIARPEDTKNLSEFYKTFLSRGLVDVKVDRNGDFFAPYAVQSDQHLTYQLREDDKLEGIASFVIRDVLLDDKVQKVAFGRDLRISSNRRAVLEWSKHFLPVMNEVFKTFDCKYLFSVLSMGDVQALNAFVRPRTLKRPLPQYHLFRRFNMVSVHGRLPWARTPLPHLRIRRGSAANVDALIYYIIQKSRQRDLATVWDAQSFHEKLERWKDLNLEDFLVAFDKNDNIVGCCAPWSAGNMQEFIPMEYSLRAHNFRQFLKFGKRLGWTRTLTKPYSRLKVEAGFNFKYLCFLFADNGDIFQSLLWKAYDEAHEHEFIVYNQQRSEYIYRRPPTLISAKMPFGIYLLHPPDQEIPSFLHPANEKAAEMEPFFAL